MYELAGAMSAARLTAIARQAYVEMLSSGYTTVAEFHYLHREPGSAKDSDVMFDAIRTAARTEGIFFDPTYNGKALAALIDMIRTGQCETDDPVLIVHTGGVPALFVNPELMMHE